MSKTHQLKEYIKYRKKARGRHGVHSPFVYDLTEKLLKQKSEPANLVLATSRYKRLVNSLIGYFGCRHVLWLTNKDGEPETYITIEEEGQGQIKLRTERFSYDNFSTYPPPELYLVDLQDPADWYSAWNKYRELIRPNDIALFIAPHHSKGHTTAWKTIHQDEKVRLSIDLFKVGLLFFREEFKEPQHFVLKAH